LLLHRHADARRKKLSASRGHDLPGLIDEPVPNVATVVDDIVEGFEQNSDDFMLSEIARRADN